jgi:hypothetical protein
MNNNPAWRAFGPFLAAAERLLDRVLCVAGAVLFAQAPEFIQQYLQRLGGRLDEARRQLEQLRDAASRSGLTVDQLAASAASSPEPGVASLGGVIRSASERVDALAAAQNAIGGASAFTRPFAFIRHFDPATARATLSIFRPAVPTTLEGFAYAAAGMVILLSAYHFGVRYPIRKAWAARRARRAGPTAEAGAS